MKAVKRILALAAIAAASVGSVAAAPIVIDGLVGDWGITVGDNNTSNFVAPAVSGTQFFAYAREDQNDLTGDGGYLGPYYGGQRYDVEFMGVSLTATRMNIVVVTGQRPSNGLERFSPGDLRIVGNDGHVFGIEVGGGTGGGAGTALHTGDVGSTYSLNSHGFTASYSNAPALQSVGSVWRDPGWINDAILHATPVQMSSAAGGTRIGMADVVYTRNSLSSQHAVIEIGLDRSLLGSTATAFDLFWAPGCNNDFLTVHDDVPAIPEPASLALLGLGMVALCTTCAKRSRI